MPIQFQCPNCQHAMQLPDAAAGKQGKCPKCAAVITVPAAAVAAAPLSAHDEEFWSAVDPAKKPDERKEEAHGHGGGGKKSAAKLLKSYLTKGDEDKGPVKRIGLPWENPRNGTVLERYWDTAIGIMNNPKEFFAEMRLQGGIGQPLVFSLIGVTMGTFFAAVYSTAAVVIFGVAGVNAVEPEQKNTAIMGLVILATIIFFSGFFGGVFGTLIHIFLQAAGLQLTLYMTGVKDVTFEKTFRITGYCNGSISLCNIVPGIGAGFMMGLWFMGMINGVVSVYEVKAGKATLAVLLLFLPLILPILAVTVILIMSVMYGGGM